MWDSSQDPFREPVSCKVIIKILVSGILVFNIRGSNTTF